MSCGEERFAVSHGGNDVELSLQQRTQFLSDRRMIISQEHARALAFLAVARVLLKHFVHSHSATAWNMLPPSQRWHWPPSFGEHHRDATAAYKSKHAYLDNELTGMARWNNPENYREQVRKCTEDEARKKYRIPDKNVQGSALQVQCVSSFSRLDP